MSRHSVMSRNSGLPALTSPGVLMTGDNSGAGTSCFHTFRLAGSVASSTAANCSMRRPRPDGRGSATTSRSMSDTGVCARRDHDPKIAAATRASP
jgi:hypothetical protein